MRPKDSDNQSAMEKERKYSAVKDVVGFGIVAFTFWYMVGRHSNRSSGYAIGYQEVRRPPVAARESKDT